VFFVFLSVPRPKSHSHQFASLRFALLSACSFVPFCYEQLSPWPIYRSCNSSSRSINAIQFSPFVKAVPALNCIADQTGGWAARSTSQRIPNHHSLISWKPLSDTKILHISHLEHYSSLLVYITHVHVPIVYTSYPALLKKRGLSQSRCG